MIDKTPIFFWGATGQAIVLNEILKSSDFRLTSVFDRNESVRSPFKDVPIYHDEKAFFNFLDEAKEYFFSIAIGGDGGRDRLMLQEKLVKKGFTPVKLIHPQSNIASDVTISEGSQILINVTLSSRVEIGRQVIINTSASVDHECMIADGAHIGPGAVLAGCVKVGECSFIGAGSVILPGIEVGKDTVIGAGSVVTRNIPEGVIAYGNPCKVMKEKS